MTGGGPPFPSGRARPGVERPEEGAGRTARGLSAEQVARYEADGFVFPIDALGADEAERYRRLYEEARRKGAELGIDAVDVKGHLVLRWMADLARDPRILDAVESVLGPDILCWTTNFFVKRPGDRTYVSWHQDATYWG